MRRLVRMPRIRLPPPQVSRATHGRMVLGKQVARGAHHHQSIRTMPRHHHLPRDHGTPQTRNPVHLRSHAPLHHTRCDPTCQVQSVQQRPFACAPSVRPLSLDPMDRPRQTGAGGHRELIPDGRWRILSRQILHQGAAHSRDLDAVPGSCPDTIPHWIPDVRPPRRVIPCLSRELQRADILRENSGDQGPLQQEDPLLGMTHRNRGDSGKSGNRNSGNSGRVQCWNRSVRSCLLCLRRQ